VTAKEPAAPAPATRKQLAQYLAEGKPALVSDAVDANPEIDLKTALPKEIDPEQRTLAMIAVDLSITEVDSGYIDLAVKITLSGGDPRVLDVNGRNLFGHLTSAMTKAARTDAAAKSGAAALTKPDGSPFDATLTLLQLPEGKEAARLVENIDPPPLYRHRWNVISFLDRLLRGDVEITDQVLGVATEAISIGAPVGYTFTSQDGGFVSRMTKDFLNPDQLATPNGQALYNILAAAESNQVASSNGKPASGLHAKATFQRAPNQVGRNQNKNLPKIGRGLHIFASQQSHSRTRSV